MRTVAQDELEKHVATYIRAAEAGETVLVTDRDRVVARLLPAEPSLARGTDEAVIADLIARSLVSPRTVPRGTRPRRHRLIPHEQLMADLDRDREDRS